MFTKCPNPDCGATYAVNARVLRYSQGMIRCLKCRAVFNALTSLDEQHPGGQVIELHRLLPAEGSVGAAAPETLAPAAPGAPVGAPTPAPASASAVAAGTAPATPTQPRTEEPEPSALAHPPSPAAASAPPVAGLLGALTDFLPRAGDWHYASRNLLRHRRRTALALMAIGFGVVAVLLAGGFIEWSKWFLRETTIRAHLGHIQIVKQGYFKSGEADPFGYLMPEGGEVLEAVERDPDVAAVAPRLAFSGLIGFGDVSVSFLGEGVDPAREAKVSQRLSIVEGRDLGPDTPRGIIMGKGLADNLMVEPGQQVVLLASSESGGLGMVEGTVTGIFQTASKAYDDAALRVPIEMARELTRSEGSHRYVVLLHDTAATDTVLARLRARFGPETGLEFVPWLDLADFYKKSAALFAAQANAVWAVIALIIVVSISNTLVMNVVERTGEIGTLMALGLRGRKIQALFLNEGMLLGLLGGLMGAGVGWALAALISAVGIPLPPAPGMDFPVTGEIMLTPTLVAGGLALGVGATLLASLYPARKASRLAIVDALRHGR